MADIQETLNQIDKKVTIAGNNIKWMCVASVFIVGIAGWSFNRFDNGIRDLNLVVGNISNVLPNDPEWFEKADRKLSIIEQKVTFANPSNPSKASLEIARTKDFALLTNVHVSGSEVYSGILADKKALERLTNTVVFQDAIKNSSDKEPFFLAWKEQKLTDAAKEALKEK